MPESIGFAGFRRRNSGRRVVNASWRCARFVESFGDFYIRKSWRLSLLTKLNIILNVKADLDFVAVLDDVLFAFLVIQAGSFDFSL